MLGRGWCVGVLMLLAFLSAGCGQKASPTGEGAPPEDGDAGPSENETDDGLGILVPNALPAENVTFAGCTILVPNFIVPEGDIAATLPDDLEPVPFAGIPGAAAFNLAVQECEEASTPSGPLETTVLFLMMTPVVAPTEWQSDSIDAYRFAIAHGVGSPVLHDAYRLLNWTFFEDVDVEADLNGVALSAPSSATTETANFTLDEETVVATYQGITEQVLRVFFALDDEVVGWIDLHILAGPRFYTGEGTFEATGDWPLPQNQLAGAGFQYGWDSGQRSLVHVPYVLPPDQ
jgi:hypothetical protein